MSNEKPPKRLVIQWATLKGMAAIILFLLLSVLIEYAIVVFAMNLGVVEKPENKIFGFISPLFHLVPASVITTLVFCWIYLTRHVAVRPRELQKGKTVPLSKGGKKQRFRDVNRFFDRIKSGLLKTRAVAYLWQRIHFARATIRSAVIVFLAFLAFTLLISFLAYPRLIYEAISGTYKGNQSLLGFIRGTGNALAPIGGFFSTINNALLSIAPSFRNFVLSVGVAVKPLIELDNAGKYLVFQNIGAWASALIALVYGKYVRRSYRHKKTRKS